MKDPRELLAAFEAFVAAKVNEMDHAATIEDAVVMTEARLALAEALAEATL